MMAMEIVNTTPNSKKIARYPGPCLAMSAPSCDMPDHFPGVTAHPLMVPPLKYTARAIKTMPIPSQTAQ